MQGCCIVLFGNLATVIGLIVYERNDWLTPVYSAFTSDISRCKKAGITVCRSEGFKRDFSLDVVLSFKKKPTESHSQRFLILRRFLQLQLEAEYLCSCYLNYILQSFLVSLSRITRSIFGHVSASGPDTMKDLCYSCHLQMYYISMLTSPN